MLLLQKSSTNVHLNGKYWRKSPLNRIKANAEQGNYVIMESYTSQTEVQWLLWLASLITILENHTENVKWSGNTVLLMLYYLWY